jgi:hypothetical protein
VQLWASLLRLPSGRQDPYSDAGLTTNGAQGLIARPEWPHDHQQRDHNPAQERRTVRMWRARYQGGGIAAVYDLARPDGRR